MHVLVHDFGGYPYPADLSRALAARGHRVTHAFCPLVETTPGGAFARRRADPDNLAFVPIDLGEPLARHSFMKRWNQDRHYGSLAADVTLALRPDVVISANMPLDAQARLVKASQRLDIPFVFWLQDLIGVATYRLLRRKLWAAGAVVGRYYVQLERRLLLASDAVIPISDDFRPFLKSWGIDGRRITTIENWAPLEDLPVRGKDNPWARARGLTEHFVFLYAGTMGMKHNPELLARLAEAMRDSPDVRVVVLSQGPGAEYLRQQRDQRHLSNLIIQGYEPFERMPDVMGAADVLVGVLEREAGAFSVPSKVVAYLCGQRPLLLAMPAENLAARLVVREGAGIVVGPDDPTSFVEGGRRLLSDPQSRAAMAAAGRRYAESACDIGIITNRFEAILGHVVSAGTYR